MLRTLGTLEVPKYAVKKSEYQITRLPEVIKTWCWNKAKKVAKRQVLNIGESFSIPIPPLLRKWQGENSLNHYNAMTIEIYDGPNARIGWHKNSMKGASYEYITMCSFALENKDLGEVLCDMEFEKMLRPYGFVIPRASHSTRSGVFSTTKWQYVIDSDFKYVYIDCFNPFDKSWD